MDLGELYGSIGLDDSQFTGALDRALGHLKGFAKTGGLVAGTAGLAIATAMGASIVQGLDLQDGRHKLAAELGLSAADSERIGKVAGKLFAQNYGDSMDGVNDAIAAVKTSIHGLDSDKALAGATKQALNYAKVFDVDVARAAQLAGESVTYGLAKNSTEAFDLLITASRRVPVALREDLLDATDEYGHYFSGLGYSGKEAFALLVDASKKGMYGIDKTGDAIKELSLRATDLSDTTAVAALQSIGLNAKDTADALLAGGDKAYDGTQRIIEGLLGMKDPAAQAQAAVALLGAPIEDLNKGDIPEFLASLKGGSKAMDGFKNASKRVDTELSAGANKSLGQLKRQAQTAFFMLGNWALPKVNQLSAALASNFGPALAAVIAVLSDLYSALNQILSPIGGLSTLATVLGVTLTAILIPAIIAWGAQTLISATKSATAWTLTQLSAIKGAAATALAATATVAGWVLMGAQALLGAAKVAAAWLIALGPIGLVIAAVALIVAVVIKYWDQISAFTAAAWSKISGAVSGAISWVIDFVKAHWPLILAIITGPIGLIVLAIVKNMDRIKGFMSATWNAIQSAAHATWSGIVGFITGGAATIVNAVRGIPGRLRSLIGSFGSAGRALINAFVDGLKNAGGVISGIAGNVWNAVRSLLNGAIDKINASLEFKISIPGPDVHINAPNIPHMADGGIVNKPTLLLAGEAGPELIQPLSGPKAKEAQRNVFGPSEMGPAQLQPIVQVDMPITTQPSQDNRQIGNAAAERLGFVLGMHGVPTR